MLHIITYVVVFVGFFFGGLLGGAIGSFVGATLALLVCLTAIDKFVHRRRFHGFFIRHRGLLVEFLSVILLVTVGVHFLGESLGILIGIFLGEFGGRYLSEKLGWGPSAHEARVAATAMQLRMLADLIPNDSNSVPTCLSKLKKIARRYFEPSGLNSDADIESIVDLCLRQPVNVFHYQVMARVHLDLKRQFLTEALEIVYCQPEISQFSLDQLKNLSRLIDLEDDKTMEFYDRAPTIIRVRQPAMEVLGLCPQATQEAIDEAYRTAAKKYHPDRLQGLPDHMAELAKQKMIEINSAYDVLKGSRDYRLKLTFLSRNGEDLFVPPENTEFISCCWLCRRLNRLSADGMIDSARCGSCHAFLGIVWS